MEVPIAAAISAIAAPTAEAAERAPAPPEKPVLAAVQDLAETLSDSADQPAAGRSAALDLAFENRPSAATADAVDASGGGVSAAALERDISERTDVERALAAEALGIPSIHAQNRAEARLSALGVLFIAVNLFTTLPPLSIIHADALGFLSVATGLSAAFLITSAVGRLLTPAPAEAGKRRARFGIAALMATVLLSALLAQAGRLQLDLSRQETSERAAHSAGDWPIQASLNTLVERSAPGYVMSKDRDPFWAFLDSNVTVAQYVAQAHDPKKLGVDPDLSRLFDVANPERLPALADLQRFHDRVRSDPALRADARRVYLEFLKTLAPRADPQAQAAREKAAQAVFSGMAAREARREGLARRREAFYREVPLLALLSAAWVFLVSVWRRIGSWLKPGAAALLALLLMPTTLLAGDGSVGGLAAGTLLALSPLLLFLLPRFRGTGADKPLLTLPRALLAYANSFVVLLVVGYVDNAPLLWILSIAALLLPPWIAADAAIAYFGSWLIALRTGKRPFQFRLSSILFATAAAALLTQSALRLPPSIGLSERASLANFGLSGVRRSFTEDHDFIHGGPRGRFHRFLGALKNADLTLLRPDNDSYLTRILLIDDAFDLFAQRKAPLSDQEVSDMYARYLANSESPHWQNENDFRTLAALHRLWLETKADPKLRRSPDEIYRRYTLERVRLAPEKERADAEISARLAEANLALYRRPPADLFIGWLASLSVAAALWGFARGRPDDRLDS